MCCGPVLCVPGTKRSGGFREGFLFWNSAVPSRVSLVGDGKGHGLGARRPSVDGLTICQTFVDSWNPSEVRFPHLGKGGDATLRVSGQV